MLKAMAQPSQAGWLWPSLTGQQMKSMAFRSGWRYKQLITAGLHPSQSISSSTQIHEECKCAQHKVGCSMLHIL